MKSNSSEKLGNILLVDDEPNNLRVLAEILSKNHYEARGTLSGAMALKAAKTMPPDLILLDIMMPQMDGYEVCEHLKADPLTREIPIIFISVKNEAIDKVKAFNIGGVDYITKPFHNEEVIVRVKTHINLRKLQQQLQQKNEQLQAEVLHRQAAEQMLKEKNKLLQHEIFNRQNIETALQKTNDDLTAINIELDHFACLASHDLKSPLNSIFAYIKLFLIHYENQVDSEGIKYLQNILNACKRMQLLIDDLLIFSRTGRTQNVFKPVDFQSLVEHACENLKSRILETKAVITYQNLPTILGDESLLVQLFQNLIANSLQYCQEKKPNIKIRVESQDAYYLFSIQDNGIGIEPQYFEQIFKVFQRLHTQKEYPGTGVGLALCRKIVESHGGKIWVESEEGKGSTFYFTLQKSVEENSQNEVAVEEFQKVMS